jgi:two-component system chemotaxis response regulator CheY
MRILVVDDDYVSRVQTKALLSNYGDCDAAPDGALALDLIKSAHAENAPYELITLDVDMPTMRGQEVLRLIREFETSNGLAHRGTEAKVLMVSALDDGKSIMSSFRQGCEGYVVKPLTPSKLAEALEHLRMLP